MNTYNIPALNNEEQKYLRYFSILPTTEIGRELLIQLFGVEEVHTNVFFDILNGLITKGWLTGDGETYKIDGHRQTVIKERLKPDAENCKGILIKLASLLDFKQIDNPLTRQKYLPFAENIFNSINDKTPEIAILLLRYSIILTAIGNYSDALDFLLKTLKIQEAVLPEQHPDFAETYLVISDVLERLGRYEQQLEYALKAKVVGEQKGFSNDSELADIYHSIGIAYRNLENFNLELGYKLKAKYIRENIVPPNNLDISNSFLSLGIAYWNLGQFDISLEHFIKSYEYAEKDLPPEHPDWAVIFENLGAVYNRLGDEKKPLEYYLKALKIRESVFGINDPKTKSIYLSIGEIYSKLGDKKKAEVYLKKSEENSELVVLEGSIRNIVPGKCKRILREIKDKKTSPDPNLSPEGREK